MKTILETPRLLLREMSHDDLDFIAALLADPEVMRFYPKCYSREEAAAWIERQLGRYASHGHGFWLAADRATGEPRGQVGLLPQTVEGELLPEIGYLIHRPFWRQGLASEAAQGVRDFAFGTLGKPFVISLIRPVNRPSLGVARKLGMRPWKHTMFGGFDHLICRLKRGKLVIFDLDGTLTPHRESSSDPFERRLCEGIAERVRELRDKGYHLALATNQGGVKHGFPVEEVEAQLAWIHETLGISVRRYAVELEDKKPNPRMLLELLAQFGVFPTDAVMVGDSVHDCTAAEAAGVAFIHVREFIANGI